jgi:hypothetical protein
MPPRLLDERALAPLLPPQALDDRDPDPEPDPELRDEPP